MLRRTRIRRLLDVLVMWFLQSSIQAWQPVTQDQINTFIDKVEP